MLQQVPLEERPSVLQQVPREEQDIPLSCRAPCPSARHLLESASSLYHHFLELQLHHSSAALEAEVAA